MLGMTKSSKPESTPHPGSAPDRKPERIAKVIARAGLCSRREAEALIAAGRVAVNGHVIASPALNVAPQDRVTVDGKPLPVRERTRLFLFHKPRGLVTTRSDPQGRPTVFDELPKDLPRLISVGRLDINTEGLLLLTNDGGLARLLELPSTGWLRRYRVRAHGRITQADLDRLRDGITVDGVRYGPIEATLDPIQSQGANLWLTFAMREGKNREIKNVLGALGLKVNRLIRVSYGPFQLGELPPGGVEEVRTRTLREQLGPRLAVLSGADFSGPLLQPGDRAAPGGAEATPSRASPAQAAALRPQRFSPDTTRGRPEDTQGAENRIIDAPRRAPRGRRKS
jgi:23S rRNA pseudouridine2605 synthase